MEFLPPSPTPERSLSGGLVVQAPNAMAMRTATAEFDVMPAMNATPHAKTEQHALFSARLGQTFSEPKNAQ
jgi:hypothetical protein